jgi:hypothetical protein|tara:strand:+ start:22657 stop:23205 length:549 start_codon:yes stop_codon:yes gene_type:complete
MKFFKYYCFLILMLMVSPMRVLAEPSRANALSAHVHGVATLQVAVDSKILTINFSSPLDNLLGFESKAPNETKRKQVQQMINQFHKPHFFMPTPSAQCELSNVDLQSPVIKNNAGVSTHEHIGHTDLDAELHYDCHHVKDLRDLQVNLFKAFPKLHQLNVEIVSDRGQSATQLTPDNDQAVW